MEACRYPLPKLLQNNKSDILEAFAHATGSPYDTQKWRDSFPDDDDLSDILKRFPGRITRTNVRTISEEARAGGYHEVHKLFLASMVWGWAGIPDGPSKTRRMLSAQTAEEMLRATARRIEGSKIDEAYRHFDLPPCIPAFFTKFFYFVGLGAETRPLPLVLDHWVAVALERICAEEGWKAAEFVKRTGWNVERYPEGYVRYVCCMSSWAEALGCGYRKADSIEYFLFKLGQSLGKRRKTLR